MTVDDFLTSNMNVSTSSLISSSVSLISEDSEASNSKSRNAILFLVPVKTQSRDNVQRLFYKILIRDTAVSKGREQPQEVTQQQIIRKGIKCTIDIFYSFTFLSQRVSWPLHEYNTILDRFEFQMTQITVTCMNIQGLQVFEPFCTEQKHIIVVELAMGYGI